MFYFVEDFLLRDNLTISGFEVATRLRRKNPFIFQVP